MAIEFYPTHRTLPDSYMSYDRSVVVPPDAATVSTALIAVELLENSKIAQQLYDGAEVGPSVTDFGAGSGALGAVVLECMPEIAEVRAVDVDPHTFRYGKQNLHRANYGRLRRELGLSALTFMLGDWNSHATWEACAPADLIMCNPPYLIAGECMRPGYEHTPLSHLYLDDETAVARTYTTILTESLKRMRRWDVTVMRLPVAIEGENAAEWCVEAVNRLRQSSPCSSSTEDGWHALRTFRLSSAKGRDAHVLAIEKLPLDYPCISVLSDARVDRFKRTGIDPGVLNVGPKHSSNRLLTIIERF